MLLVVREMDRGYAAASQLASNDVAVPKGVGEGGFNCSHDTAGWKTNGMCLRRQRIARQFSPVPHGQGELLRLSIS